MKKWIIFTFGLAGIAGIMGIATFHQPTERSSSTQRREEQVTSQDVYVVDQSDLYHVDSPEPGAAMQTLTPEEERWLIHMREEEKLARDVYTTLGQTWDLRIFSNIAASEQTHTDAVKNLLERYGVADPATDDTVGVFTIPDMQQLYETLVAQGTLSALEALKVGATIEDLDIHDLDQALGVTQQSDIRTVYKNLQKGSRNHLRAFVRTIENQGSIYAPAYISETEYNAILSSAPERGRAQ